MSEPEKRRHHASRSRGGRRWLVRLAWTVVVLLLAGNLALAFFNRREDTPQGFVTPEMLQAAGYWVPVAVGVVAAVCGLVWASKAYRHSERTSLVWARRAHWFSLLAAIGLTLACFERDVFPREWFAVAASVLLAAQTVLAAMFSLKEYRRAETGEGSRRARPRPETLPQPPAAAGPAESSGLPR